MKTLVTGGAGFIGSHLVERLLQDGHQVVVLDNLATGNPENLNHIGNSSRLEIRNIDVTNLEQTNDALAGAEWVFHLAALADIVPSIKDPMTYHRNNVDGTVSVLEAARNAGVQRFVYAASSSCYGIADQLPTPESASIQPMYPYALTKYVGEQYVRHWARLYSLPCVSLRLFNVYGPRARTTGTYGAVFGVFLAQKLAGKPYTVVGDGTQTRDFTFVTDVADAFVRTAEADAQDEVFNVGSGNTYSINYLVDLLGGEKIQIPKRPGEPDSTFADTQKIRSVLGWQPQVSFEQGVALMIENMEQWRAAPVWDRESISEATKEWFEYLGGKPTTQKTQ